MKKNYILVTLGIALSVVGILFFEKPAFASRDCEGQWEGSTVEIELYNNANGQLIQRYHASDPSGSGRTNFNASLTVPFGTDLMIKGVAYAPDHGAYSRVNYPYGQGKTWSEGAYDVWHTWLASNLIESDTAFFWEIEPSCQGGEVSPGFDPGRTEINIAINLPDYALNVTKDGTGSGTVTSNLAGIDCGSDCSHSYSHGTSVTLAASPVSGSYFVGWSGEGCSGTGTCTVSMTQERNVNARFDLIPPPSASAWISASPNPVNSGTATTISWGSSNTSSCSVTQGGGSGFNTGNATSGSDSTSALSGNTTFAISCTGGYGTATANVTVSVINTSTADIRADNSNGPVMKTYWTTAAITWTSSNAGACSVTANGVATGWTGISGSQTTPNLTGTITYVLNCASASDQVVVTVPPPPTNPTGSCPMPGTNASISWNAPSGYNRFYVRAYDLALGYPPSSWAIYDDNYASTTASFSGTAGHTYSWWVHTRDTATGAYSVSVGTNVTCQAPAEITFNVTYIPAALTKPEITSLDNSACGNITINWSYTAAAGDPLQYFTVWRATTPGGYGASPVWSSRGTANASTVRSWNDTTVSPGTIYYYKVKAEEDTPDRQTEASDERNIRSAECVANMTANMRIIQVDGQPYDSNTSLIKDGSRLTYQLIIANAGPSSATITSICDKLSSNMYRTSGADISPSNVTASGTNASAVSTPLWGSGNCSGANSVTLGITGVKQPPAIDSNNWAINFQTVFRKNSNSNSSYEVCSNVAEVFYTDGEGSKSITASVPNALCKTGKNLSPDYREVNP